MTQEKQRGRRGPVKVVKYDEQRALACPLGHETDNTVEQRHSIRSLIDTTTARPARLMAKFWQKCDDTWVSQNGKPVRIMASPMLEPLYERLERNVQVLVAGAPQDKRTLAVGKCRDFSGQASLADSRFTRDKGELEFAGRGAPPCLCQPRLFLVSANEDCLTGPVDRGRQGYGTGCYWLPLNAHDVDRIVEALQHSRAQRRELVTRFPANDQRHDPSRQHVATGRLIAGDESSGFDNGWTVPVAIFKSRLTCADADADCRMPHVKLAKLVHPALERDRGSHSVTGAQERGHNTVAGALHFHAAVAGERSSNGSYVLPS
jgi:hypothetical protein